MGELDLITDEGLPLMRFTVEQLELLDEALKVILTAHPMAKFGYAKRFEPLEERTQRLLDAICARAD